MQQINIFLSRLLLVAAALSFSLSLQAQTVYDVVAGSDDHNTLEAAVNAAQLRTALEDSTATLTLFAPTDSAFAALGDLVNDLVTNTPTGDLADILLYHVLGMNVPSANVTNGLITTPLNTTNTLKFTRRSADDVLFVNQAQITVRDLPASNGVVHVIDAVILPGETVADVAIDNGFGTLVTAVVAAELLPALTDPAGTYTVFAPTDSAFMALGDTLNDLLADPTGNLANTLLYHVLGSTVTSDMLMDGQIVETLFTGNVLSVDLSDGVKINDSEVILANVSATNGVVHLINKVLTPDFPTSTVELQLTSLQVFPNPTTDFVNINVVEKDYQYSIFDVSGAIQQNGNLLQGSNSIRLNNLSNGTYFMKIFNDKAFKTVRLVVNRKYLKVLFFR